MNKELTEVEILKLKEAVRVGIESEIPLIKYIIFLFTLSCIVGAFDMSAPTHDVSTVFNCGISNTHQSGFPLADVVQISLDERKKHRVIYSMQYKDISDVSIV